MKRASSAEHWRAQLGAYVRRGVGGLRTTSPFDVLSALLFAAAVLCVSLTFDDFGLTWDEKIHLDYGDRILSYYASGGEDHAALGYGAGKKPTYGGGFDLLGALARGVSPLGPFATLHLLGGLLGVLGVLGAWKLGRLLAGPAGGFWSALLLMLTPVYAGHSFNNPKDAPFAVGYVWAVYFICALVRRLPAPPAGLWVKLSIALGAAMCVRVAGVVTVGYLLLALVAYSVHRGWMSRRASDVRRCLSALGPKAAAAVAGAWAIMLVTWPWAMQAPLRRPLTTLTVVSNFNQFIAHRPYGDQKIWSYEVPWDYLPRYFAIKLPEPVLVLVVIGTLMGVVYVARRGRDEARFSSMLAYGILAISIVAPPAFAIINGSALYDGLRHFLFVVPVLCVAAAVTLVALETALRRRARALSVLCIGAAAIGCADQVRILVHLHPHEYVYFNSLVGGLPGAADRYDTDYYGNSYRELFAKLERHLWQSEGEAYLTRTYTASGCIATYAANRYLPPNFRWVPLKRRRHADFFLGYRRGGCHEQESSSPVLVQVERFGTILAVARDLRPRTLRQALEQPRPTLGGARR